MKLHLANTNLEEELQNPAPLPASLHTHRNYLQFQYLPLLYTDEPILVTEKPPIPGNFVLYGEQRQFDELDVWSASPATAAIASHFGAKNPAQPLDLLRLISSKLYVCAPENILKTEEDLTKWLADAPYPKVLKSPHGHSGRGHQIFYQPARPKFTELPLIGEPWHHRQRDFSTQWKLGDQVAYLGHCHLENSANGGFHKAITGQKEPLLDEHLRHAEKVVSNIHKLGYRGHLGIDAFVADTLHPIIEINPRKTMGWLALQVAKKRGTSITLICGKMEQGLLPIRKKALNVAIREN